MKELEDDPDDAEEIYEAEMGNNFQTRERERKRERERRKNKVFIGCCLFEKKWIIAKIQCRILKTPPL